LLAKQEKLCCKDFDDDNCKNLQNKYWKIIGRLILLLLKSSCNKLLIVRMFKLAYNFIKQVAST